MFLSKSPCFSKSVLVIDVFFSHNKSETLTDATESRFCTTQIHKEIKFRAYMGLFTLASCIKINRLVSRPCFFLSVILVVNRED